MTFYPKEFYTREIEPKLCKSTDLRLIKPYIRSVRLEFLECSSEVLNEFLDLLVDKIDEVNAPFEKFELSQPERAFAQLNPETIQAFTNKVLNSIKEVNLSGLCHSSP